MLKPKNMRTRFNLVPPRIICFESMFYGFTSNILPLPPAFRGGFLWNRGLDFLGCSQTIDLGLFGLLLIPPVAKTTLVSLQPQSSFELLTRRLFPPATMLGDSSSQVAHGPGRVLIGEGDDRRGRWGHPQKSKPHPHKKGGVPHEVICRYRRQFPRPAVLSNGQQW